MNASLTTIENLFEAIKKAEPVFEKMNSSQKEKEQYLESKGFSKKSILSIADIIGISLKITQENVDRIEWFADFLKVHLNAFAKSIHIYIEIIKVAAHKSSIYRTLMDIHLYDMKTIDDFDFIGNALNQFSKPIFSDPIFQCMSYTYIGHLFQRIGRFWDARAAYKLAMSFHNDPRKITQVAAYGNLELDYLAQIASTDYFQTYESQTPSHIKPLILIGSIFFGAPYEQLFRQVAGASFFCKTNIEALKKRWHPVLIVFCTLFEKMHFEHSSLYQEISKDMSVQIVIIPDWLISKYPEPTPQGHDIHPALAYSLSGLIQTCLLVIAKQSNACIINLPPDCIFSNTTMIDISNAVSSGHKVVFTPGIRLERQAILTKISTMKRNKSGALLSIPSSELTRMALENLHPATKASFATQKKMTNPGIIAWPLDKDGLICHFFQMHPIYISNDLLKNNSIKRFDSIDGDLIYRMMPCNSEWKHIHVVTDPERVMMFELSGPGVLIDIKYTTDNLVQSAGSWIADVMRPLSFWLLKKRVVFGSIPTSDTNQKTLTKADGIISNLVEFGNTLNYTIVQRPEETHQSGNLNIKMLVESWAIEGSSKDTRNQLTPTPVARPIETLRVIFSLAVWGRKYINNFLNICLPSMLAEGNLLDLPNNKSSLFVLYTCHEDIPLFKENIQFQCLKKLIPVEIVSINPQAFSNKYSVLNSAQSDTVQRSTPFDVICFLYSDFVWAKGGMQFSLKKIAQGYEGVVSPVPPVVLEDFYTLLGTHLNDFITSLDDEDGLFSISIDNRTLVRHAKSILHPMMRDNILDYKVNTGNPAYVLWLGPNDDLLIRCFHAHPVMLKVKPLCPHYLTPFTKTLDEGFLPNAYPATDRLYFIQDSDELTIISLSEVDFPTPYIDNHYHLDAANISQWAESVASPMHKIMFNYKTIWHEKNVILSDWESTFQRSEATTREVFFRLSMPDVVQCSEFSAGRAARLNRALRFGYADHSEKKIMVMGPTKSKIIIPFLLFKCLYFISCRLPMRIKQQKNFQSLKNSYLKRTSGYILLLNAEKENAQPNARKLFSVYTYFIWPLKVVSYARLQLRSRLFRS